MVKAPGCGPGSGGFDSPLSPQEWWLVGLLEGEGSFIKGPPSRPSSPIIQLQMTDRDVARAAEVMGTYVYACRYKAKAHHKSTYRAFLIGERAVDLMKRLQPHMGERRQEQISAALECWSGWRASKILGEERRRTIAARRHAGERAVDLAAEYGIAREYVYALARKYPAAA